MKEDKRPPEFDPTGPTFATAGGPRRLRDEPLLRLLFVNWVIGAAVAGVVTAAVLITDTAHLRSLMMSSSEPWIPMILLFFGFLITMSSVAMATAVMMLPTKSDDDDDGPGGGSPLEVLNLSRLVPIPLRVPARSNPAHSPGRDRR